MIEVVAVAAAAFGAALFRYLTAREVLKRANKKDIPAIAKAMYARHQVRRSGHLGTHQAQGGDADGPPRPATGRDPTRFHGGGQPDGEQPDQ